MENKPTTRENCKCLQNCKHAHIMEGPRDITVICGAAKNGIPVPTPSAYMKKKEGDNEIITGAIPDVQKCNKHAENEKPT